MTGRDPAAWTELLAKTLRRYDEPLLRRAAGRLLKPRNQWPLDDLIERCLATLSDVPLVERRLKELEPGECQLLAAMGHSRQPYWHLSHLVELAMSLGQDDGLRIVTGLLEAGLLYPVLPRVSDNVRAPKIRSFENWLAQGGPEGVHAWAHPLAIQRAVGEPIDLGGPLDTAPAAGPALESDGLDWLLRLAVLWQRAAENPFRRTQQGEFFKRDLERLSTDTLLNFPSTEGLPACPDAGYLAVTLARELDVLKVNDGELIAGAFGPEWTEDLPGALARLWEELPHVREWSPLDGWRHGESLGNPFPSAGLVALLLLGQLPAERWATSDAIRTRVHARHPYFRSDDIRPSRLRDWTTPFLLGVAFPLKIVQVSKAADGEWLTRLSPTGRFLLGFDAARPDLPAFPRTLLVQPNLEMIAYRQGLAPKLIAFLTRAADWKGIGSVCTLQFGPETIYRALEGGLTYEDLLQTLEKHGTRPTPPGVLDSLRTWADKRDRITVYPSAALLEFPTKEDLDNALQRGFPGQRLADRLAVVPSEESINYTLFRLTSSRDYSARPEQCVEVADDGVTLTVDLNRSDLLLESELARFAEPLDRAGSNSRRRYRLSPATLATARAAGLNEATLEQWFLQRAGEPLSPAARLLLTADKEHAPRLRHLLVLTFPSEPLTDGLLQWPATRELIAERLGPTTLAIDRDNLPALKEQLHNIGIPIDEDATSAT